MQERSLPRLILATFEELSRRIDASRKEWEILTKLLINFPSRIQVSCHIVSLKDHQAIVLTSATKNRHPIPIPVRTHSRQIDLHTKRNCKVSKKTFPKKVDTKYFLFIKNIIFKDISSKYQHFRVMVSQSRKKEICYYSRMIYWSKIMYYFLHCIA